MRAQKGLLGYVFGGRGVAQEQVGSTECRLLVRFDQQAKGTIVAVAGGSDPCGLPGQDGHSEVVHRWAGGGSGGWLLAVILGPLISRMTIVKAALVILSCPGCL